MRNLIAAVAFVAASVGIMGCGDAEEDTDQNFVNESRRSIAFIQVGLPTWTDEEIVTAGKYNCERMEALGRDGLVLLIGKSIDPAFRDEAEDFVDLSIEFYCPTSG